MATCKQTPRISERRNQQKKKLRVFFKLGARSGAWFPFGYLTIQEETLNLKLLSPGRRLHAGLMGLPGEARAALVLLAAGLKIASMAAAEANELIRKSPKKDCAQKVDLVE